MVQLQLHYRFCKQHYSILENLSVRFATEKQLKLQTLGATWKLLNQQIDRNASFSLGVHSAMIVDARKESEFGTSFDSVDRLQFENYLLLEKQWRQNFNLLASIGFTHLNQTLENKHNDYIHLSLAPSVGIKRGLMLFANYTWSNGVALFNSEGDNGSESAFTLGGEIGHRSKRFQLFVTNTSITNLGKSMMYPEENFSLSKLRFGFNIDVTLHSK